jgi:hypothetical protein
MALGEVGEDTEKVVEETTAEPEATEEVKNEETPVEEPEATKDEPEEGE